MKSLRLSYSAINTWRECHQKYRYSYIDNLSSKISAVPLERGGILHEYLDGYYRNMSSNGPAKAHADSLSAVNTKHGDRLRTLAALASDLGENETAGDIRNMADEINRIAERYYVVRGAEDAMRYDIASYLDEKNAKILMVEAEALYPIAPGIDVSSIIDLVATDRNTGQTFLWEHKTHARIPSAGRRVRDLQTTLYLSIVEEVYGISASGIIWNYLRTKTPTVPKKLKNGELSRDKSIDTTWHVYAEEIHNLNLREGDYADVRERLEERELTDFFPRAIMPVLHTEGILLRDLVISAKQLHAWRKRLEADPSLPTVRTIGAHCDFCPFNKLCDSVITGGQDTFVRAMHYKQKEDRRGRSSDVTEQTS